MENYLNIIETLKEKFENELRILGLKIRNELVVPVCSKHGLKFFSGNKIFFFARGEEVYDNVSQLIAANSKADQNLQNDLKPILELLHTEISHNDYVGFYVGNVR